MRVTGLKYMRVTGLSCQPLQALLVVLSWGLWFFV